MRLYNLGLISALSLLFLHSANFCMEPSLNDEQTQLWEKRLLSLRPELISSNHKKESITSRAESMRFNSTLSYFYTINTNPELIIPLITKYHPGFNIPQWFVPHEQNHYWANDDKNIYMPIQYINLLLKKHRNEPFTDEESLIFANHTASLHHELAHTQLHHTSANRKKKWKSLCWKVPFFNINSGLTKTGYKKLSEYCIQQEWQTDEKVPHNLAMLEAQVFHYFLRAKNAPIQKALAEMSFKSHPDDKDRGTFFMNKYRRLIRTFNLHNTIPHKAARILGIPPHINGTSPRKAARMLGLDESLYPNLASDMPTLRQERGEIGIMPTYFMQQPNKHPRQKGIITGSVYKDSLAKQLERASTS